MTSAELLNTFQQRLTLDMKLLSLPDRALDKNRGGGEAGFLKTVSRQRTMMQGQSVPPKAGTPAECDLPRPTN
ncbi:hypothetical protein, partial [Pseudophaeobacter sp.]|uniref:hypothetical protein n=1 Tax=Pseudophaeobacter sp. TaxID=1971739 RepID=UPI00260C5B29